MTDKKSPNQEYFKEILQKLSVGIYGKECIVAKALLCAVAGESMFLLGPPGTAKSLIARRLKCIFKGAKAFELHQYCISMIMESAQFQGLVQIIDIRIVPFAGNILKRNLASIIDCGNQPHILCV